MAKNEPEILLSGKTPFRIEVPYKLIDSGPGKKEKPLLVYLHGFGQNLEQFEELCRPLLSLQAYHLFLEGPYPIYDRSGSKNVSDWGRSWYLYDGNRGQFIKSLEVSSEFLQEVMDRLFDIITPARVGIVGYSMGGYLAGYYALTRWKHIHDLVVCAARIKTEVLHDEWDLIRHMNILAVHGENDKAVKPGPQQKEIEKLKEKKINAEFNLVNEGHELSESYVNAVYKWLKTNSY